MEIDREIKVLFRENCMVTISDNFSKEVVKELPHRDNNIALLSITLATCIGSVLCYMFGLYSIVYDVIVHCAVAVAEGQLPELESLALFLVATLIPSTISFALYAAADDTTLSHI